jgi:outer membrane protein assembly factor BamB
MSCWLVWLGLALFLSTALADQSAATAQEAKAILARLPVQKGICVVLGLPGPDKPHLVADIAAQSELLLYFQSPKAEEELAVRQAAAAAGLLGSRVFVDRGPWEQIHLADNLAGAIWVSAAAAEKVPQAELLRVLHPEGKAILGKEEITKAFPAGIDSWSHPFHGPDNNPQSRDRLALMPYLTQFLAEPMFSPMPEVTVAADGRLFKACGHIAHKANQNPMLNTLLGINGYNGTILWTRPLREGFVIHRNTMIATPDILYLADDESCKLIDARTGQIVGQIVIPDGVGDGKVWKWMALQSADGQPVLYALVGGEEIRPKTVASQVAGLGHWPWSMWEGHDYKDAKTNFAFGRTFVAIDPRGKKILWKHHEEEFLDGRGVCMKDGRIYYYSPEKFLACLDAASGKVLWKTSDAELLKAIGPTGRAQNPKEGYATSSFIKCDDKYVYFAGPQRPNLTVISARDGKLLWQKNGGNLHLILRPDAFYAVGPGGAKLAYGTWETLCPLPNRRSCTRATGSIDSIFYRAAEGTMQICTADDRPQHIAPMRPPCQDGVVIANGMLYWGPWMCGCPLSFYGHVGLAPAARFAPHSTAEQSRLEAGQGDPTAVKPLPVAAGDWPTYGADNQRTCATVTAIPSQVRRQWTFQPRCGGRPTAPIAAGNLVFVGDDNGVLRALDAASGKPRWETYTGGAIFLPPALWEGRLYAGSADGRVYAFEAATGRRLWSFRAAPADRWIPVYGKLISTWPLSGGVVVEDGLLYTAAGMAHYDGTYVYALDAVTGKVKWCNDSSGSLSEQVRSGISLQGELFLRGGRLCFSGGTVYQTAGYDLQTGKCLNEPIHFVASQHATAFYPFYPQYGQYSSLNHRLPDGRTLSYDVAYEGSRDTTLAMLRPQKLGELERPFGGRLNLRKTAKPAEDAIWECKSPRRFNGFIVASNALVAAGQETSDGKTKCFVAAVNLQDGSDLWQQQVAAAVVKGGQAVDHNGRIFVSLDDGQVLCLGAAGE